VRKLSASLCLVLLALVIFAAAASAGVTWCRSDPIVELNGKRVQIWVAVPEQYASQVSGPIQIEINAPAVVNRQLLLTDAGFNGQGESVSFTTNNGTLLPDGSFYMTFIIQVPMNGVYTTVPVHIEVVNPDGSKSYYSGSQWVVTGTFRVK
jgi:hypothetical protein